MPASVTARSRNAPPEDDERAARARWSAAGRRRARSRQGERRVGVAPGSPAAEPRQRAGPSSAARRDSIVARRSVRRWTWSSSETTRRLLHADTLRGAGDRCGRRRILPPHLRAAHSSFARILRVAARGPPSSPVPKPVALHSAAWGYRYVRSGQGHRARRDQAPQLPRHRPRGWLRLDRGVVPLSALALC